MNIYAIILSLAIAAVPFVLGIDVRGVIKKDLVWVREKLAAVSRHDVKRFVWRATGLSFAPSRIAAWPGNGPTIERLLQFLAIPGGPAGKITSGRSYIPAVLVLNLTAEEKTWFVEARTRFACKLKKAAKPGQHYEALRPIWIEGLRAAVERDGGCCVDCGNPVYIVPPNEETYTNQSGVEINKPVDAAYSPDRWNELLGYTLKNILWRCTRCNIEKRPKLNAKRECGCCTKTFRMRNWRPVA